MEQKKAFILVDFSQYENSYSAELENKFCSGQYMSTEEVRQLMYGALCTDIFVDGKIFELDYWNDMEFDLEDDLEDEPEDFEVGFEEVVAELMSQKPEKARLLHSIPGIRLAIISALLSTGDGLSPESAITVVTVAQEYDIAEQLGVPRQFFIRQSLQQYGDKMYDCLEFETNPRGIEKLYFDVTKIMENY